MSQFERLTIDDIARLAGVSRTTASMVLNGHAERYRIAKATIESQPASAETHTAAVACSLENPESCEACQ